jgi:hypothetical protein
MEDNDAGKRKLGLKQISGRSTNAQNVEKRNGKVEVGEWSEKKAQQFKVSHVLLICFLLWIW